MATRRFWMTRTGAKILLFAAGALTLVLALVISCDSDRNDSLTDNVIAALGSDTEISGGLVSHTECIWYYAPVSETSVKWEYDGHGTLNLLHQAAGFNCCPVPDCSINVDDRTITVIESDSGLCYCLCLLDAEYEITGLPAGKYLLRFQEAVSIGDDEPLECEILLQGSGCSGTCVAERSNYPWAASPTGELLSCEEGAFSIPFLSGGGVYWDYDGAGNLFLSHANEYGSCCILNEPSVYFNFSNNTIYITENVEMGMLTMMVDVKVDMLISNLPAGEYTVVLDRFMDLTTVEFTLDLVNEPTGDIGFD